MQTHNLGYPRIGTHRDLKKASEKFWKGSIGTNALLETGRLIRASNWKIQNEAGLDLIPSNDFSFYDQVLDNTMMVGAIPEAFHDIAVQKNNEMELYFAMARGYQDDTIDIKACEMTKWFDTNYHYIVPEFTKDQPFELLSRDAINQFCEAKKLGITTKPVLLGPVTYLLLGKASSADFDPLDLLNNLLPVYLEVLEALEQHGAQWVQFDEPMLATDLPEKAKEALLLTYKTIARRFPYLKIMVSSYFGALEDNFNTAIALPIEALHLDLCKGQEDLDRLIENKPFLKCKKISLGIVNGRNVWINNFRQSIELLTKARANFSLEQLMLAPSCSLLHVPCDLEEETELEKAVLEKLAFAKQKLQEVKFLSKALSGKHDQQWLQTLESNVGHFNASENTTRDKNEEGAFESDKKTGRISAFPIRRMAQKESLKLPPFPTTTIGSFPQTSKIRKWRKDFKSRKIDQTLYDSLLKKELEEVIQTQEVLGLDVLVHGEYERNDMVEYFGELLDGVAFTKNGWVQSYGSRCVKPPIIHSDVKRSKAMTVQWAKLAQSLTKKPVKGMLTGPNTILLWSFVREDQARSITKEQIACAIQEEVLDLELAGIKIIQIDEPALREGLPLKKRQHAAYLKEAIEAFKRSYTGVEDKTQIHTHMCYSSFNQIMEAIRALDVDVITIECSRSGNELMDAFVDFNYPNEIGPGVYDIHSPRVPSVSEMKALLKKASQVIPPELLWVNPDCGLKTRGWEETKRSLANMVEAAAQMRA